MWIGRVTAAFAVTVTMLLGSGCGGGSDVVTPFGGGTGTGAAPAPDTGQMVADSGSGEESSGEGADGMGGQGDPCLDNKDCVDWCWDPDADGVGECVVPCGANCPSGTSCEMVTIEREAVQACVPSPATICDTCNTSAECGGPSDLCVSLDGGQFCTIGCGQDPDICPVGFGCGLIAEIGDGQVLMQCVPDNGICCIDADGDIYGEGAGCMDVDCDDTNAAVHTQGIEVCDGFDNDCNDLVDDMVTDCEVGQCSLGALGYFETPAQSCSAAECVGDPTELCGQYTCVDGEEEGDTCATSCDGEDDLKCVPPAHCDASICEPDYPDGTACDETSDCEADHCQNDYCCAFGDCCAVATDCPTFGTQDPICTSPPTCQGTIGETVCSANSTCSNTGLLEDDSACLVTTEANDCGPYPSVFCSGAADQMAPACATSCADDTECDADAHCNPATNICEPDVNNGSVCLEDSWCDADHCQNGFCCDAGDCCASETDCPASYSSDPVCTSSAACQGERDVAVCNANSCGTSMGVADDSACLAGTVANTCGPYPSVTCSGGAVQNPPVCGGSCTADIECDTNAYCSVSGVCVPDEPDGASCNADNQCLGSHCQNGFCCASGDCCANAGDCNAYDEPSVCMTPGTCQGERTDGACNPTFQCIATTVGDDSGCATIEANECGPYPALVCTANADQVPPVCAGSCMGDSECDVAAHCAGGVCIPDEGPGGFCAGPTQCQSGLQCVDSVCCSSACTGTCQACDVPGNEGVCTNIPAGDDLDAECGFIDCGGYYDGWVGDDCYDRADVPANVAGCNGFGACENASGECATQPQGSVVQSCDATCQSPVLATCAGQSDPVCSDVNPGTNTCGVGVCENTMPQCQNGAPLSCVPNAAASGPEICNNLDDNCDGPVDNGSFSDGFEPNASCASVVTLDQVGSDATVTYSTQTIFGAGDDDYYYFLAEESDSSCECCDFFCLDEDFRVTINLSVPAGAGSYMLCANTSCGATDSNCIEVLAGQNGSRVFTFDGACPGNDDYNLYVHVYGDNLPAYECLPYTLSYQLTPGCY